MPTHTYQKWTVYVASDGRIQVQKGDTISGYCAAIYQKQPASTREHWGEFGRMSTAGSAKGSIIALTDPNQIAAGELIYHVPASSRISATPNKNSQAVADALLVKLKRLQHVRDEALELYDKIDAELVSQGKKVDNFSLGVDMAGVLASAFALFGKAVVQVGNAAYSAEAARKLLAPIFGVGIQPQNQGLVQGIAQNALGASNLLEANGDDHTVIAVAKILTTSFFDMTSPSYWSKRFAGDPKATLREVASQNAANRQSFLDRIDTMIQETQQDLSIANKK